MKGFHIYDGRIPIIATGLTNLREHGAEGPVFLRFGRDYMQPLQEAIGNPRREAADARAREEAKAHEEEYQAQARRTAQEQAAKKATEREARRPVCTGCGQKFTDERWKVALATDWGEPRRTPTRSSATAASTRPRPPTRQDQVDNERQEQDQAVPEQEAGTWFSRLRT